MSATAGVPDVDCPDFGLCCFDGCVNTCYVAPEETEEEEEEDLEYDQTLADAIEEDYDDIEEMRTHSLEILTVKSFKIRVVTPFNFANKEEKYCCCYHGYEQCYIYIKFQFHWINSNIDYHYLLQWQLGHCHRCLQTNPQR